MKLLLLRWIGIKTYLRPAFPKSSKRDKDEYKNEAILFVLGKLGYNVSVSLKLIYYMKNQNFFSDLTVV